MNSYAYITPMSVIINILLFLSVFLVAWCISKQILEIMSPVNSSVYIS